jgi:putative flippase GtrA
MNRIGRVFSAVTASRSNGGWIIQLMQHLATGVVAMTAHYVVMWLALAIQLTPVLATTAGFIVGATTKFFFSYFHIFEPERGVANAIPHYILALALQMAVNAGLLTALLSIDLPVWPAQLLTTVLLAGFNFLAYKFWVFK